MSDAYARALDALSARGPGRMVPDLARITALVGLLGDPQHAYRCVHVTGTNGKGSIVRMTSALLGGVDLRVGTYLSPHLQDVRERIQVDLEPIGPEAFAAVHAEVERLAALVDGGNGATADDAGAQRVTFFEVMTAMALAHLADVAVDVAVVEVGLGGRWDATNVVRGDVAVLGPVDLDHTELLGTTPEAIADEKLGVVEDGTHVVTAAQRPEVMAMVAAAAERAGGGLTVVGRDVRVLGRGPAPGGQVVDVDLHGRRLEGLLLPVHGAHQAENLAAALGAVAALLGPSLDRVADEVLREAVARVRVPGRLEVVGAGPAVVLDGAHNPHAAAAVAAAVAELGYRDVVLLLSCLDDKDVEGVCAALGPVASHVVVAPAPSPRAADPARLAAVARAVWAPRGVLVEVAEDVGEGLAMATGVAGPRDAVLVTGSLTAVGAARDRLLPPEGTPLAPGDVRTLALRPGAGDPGEGAPDLG